MPAEEGLLDDKLRTFLELSFSLLYIFPGARSVPFPNFVQHKRSLFHICDAYRNCACAKRHPTHSQCIRTCSRTELYCINPYLFIARPCQNHHFQSFRRKWLDDPAGHNEAARPLLLRPEDEGPEGGSPSFLQRGCCPR